MSRHLVASAVVALLSLSPVAGVAFAQGSDGDQVLAITPAPEFVSSIGSTIRLADINFEQLAPQAPLRTGDLRQGRSGLAPVLASLYVSTAVLQALDAHSTLTGLERGAFEANPLMSGITQNKFAFIGVKAAVAAGTIYATREMAKKNKVAAVVTLLAINSVYAYVAHNNYKVARGLGR
jgi:hypothetical protein